MPKRRARGDGAIYRDEKRGVYVGQITIGVDERGKRKRKTVYGRTKAEVKAKLKGVEYQIYDGTFVDESGITVYHLAKQMLDDKRNHGEIKDTTYFLGLETLKAMKEIHHIPLQALNETQIKAFLLSKVNYSQSTINKIFLLLHSTVSEAERRHISPGDPMKFVKKPRSTKKAEKIRALTREEQRKLAEILRTEDITYSRQMLLSLLTGMRMGEVNALHVEDVSFAFGSITVRRTISRGQKGEALLEDTTKTEAGIRTLPITREVKELLQDCIGEKTGGVIFTHNGKLITTAQVNATYRRTLEKFAILDQTVTTGRVDLHSLRHTFGTRCVEAGMSFKALQTLMGHTDIKITMNTYAEAQQDFVLDNVRIMEEYLVQNGLTAARESG